MKAYINYGWDKNIVNPYEAYTHDQFILSDQDVPIVDSDIPSDGWKPIKEAFLNNDMPKFNNGHIMTYFVTRCVIDGMKKTKYIT